MLEDEYWYLCKDESVRNKIVQAYIMNTKLPLEGDEENNV